MKPTQKVKQTMNKKDAYRFCLSNMERRKNKNFIVQFCVSNEVKSEYDMSEYCSIDMKSPKDWLNSCFFCYDMGKLGKGKIQLKVKLK